MNIFHQTDNHVSEQTANYVFQQAIKCEWKTRRLYILFSKMFESIPRVSTFWIELAKDEENHAKTLIQIQESMTKQQLNNKADKELLGNIRKVLSFFKKISTDQFKTLDDAYELAHELESSEINSVFKILATNFISDETLKEITISQLGNHVEKLIKFNENIGNRTWRKEVIAHNLVYQL
ncbi:MAG: hypothetical protein JXA96_08430 [Sedimentisphaerales bacterium]|nr:hypothetical protein [Sedimentisphaerales bacterium]